MAISSVPSGRSLRPRYSPFDAALDAGLLALFRDVELSFRAVRTVLVYLVGIDHLSLTVVSVEDRNPLSVSALEGSHACLSLLKWLGRRNRWLRHPRVRACVRSTVGLLHCAVD